MLAKLADQRGAVLAVGNLDCLDNEREIVQGQIGQGEIVRLEKIGATSTLSKRHDVWQIVTDPPRTIFFTDK